MQCTDACIIETALSPKSAGALTPGGGAVKRTALTRQPSNGLDSTGAEMIDLVIVCVDSCNYRASPPSPRAQEQGCHEDFERYVPSLPLTRTRSPSWALSLTHPSPGSPLSSVPSKRLLCTWCT